MSLIRLVVPSLKQQVKPVRRREIFDLGEYRNNRVYYMAGNNLSIEALTAAAVVTLRFDDPDATVRVLVVGNSYQLLPFNRIYLSNAIQAGSSLTLEFDFYGFNAEEQGAEALAILNELQNDIRLNPLRLMDAGLLIEADAIGVINAAVLLYTVPVGRAFYFLGYDMDVFKIAAGVDAGGNLVYNDGVNHTIVSLDLTALTSEGKHTQNAFSMLRLPAGATLTVSSDANSNVNFALWGIETTA